ncbi:MAG: hypothetical protein ABEK03_02795 [Candidatus Bipolaricaulia bacterium]
MATLVMLKAMVERYYVNTASLVVSIRFVFVAIFAYSEVEVSTAFMGNMETEGALLITRCFVLDNPTTCRLTANVAEA